MSQNKVALITGGFSGLGEAIGAILVQKGYTVYGTSRKEIQQSGTMIPLVMDVTDPDSVTGAIETLKAKENLIESNQATIQTRKERRILKE